MDQALLKLVLMAQHTQHMVTALMVIMLTLVQVGGHLHMAINLMDIHIIVALPLIGLMVIMADMAVVTVIVGATKK